MKELIPVGDKVLIEPDSGDGKTEAGLYLPQGVKEKDRVSSGRILRTGPGYPVPDPSSLEDEPWLQKKSRDKYFPLQASSGDYCIFLRDQAVEVEFEGKKFFVAPHSAILILIRPENK